MPGSLVDKSCLKVLLTNLLWQKNINFRLKKYGEEDASIHYPGQPSHHILRYSLLQYCPIFSLRPLLKYEKNFCLHFFNKNESIYGKILKIPGFQIISLLRKRAWRRYESNTAPQSPQYSDTLDDWWVGVLLLWSFATANVAGRGTFPCTVDQAPYAAIRQK